MKTQKKVLLDAIARDREEILEFTKALVAVATENPPGRAYPACVEVILRELREIGLEYKLVATPDGKSKDRKISPPTGKSEPRHAILSFIGQGKRTLYFHGHYDVVPAASEAQFRPRVKAGKLFGRGSADMKSGLAAMIFAVKALQTCRVKLNGRVGLTIVPDEETGGAASRHLAEIGLLGKNGIGMLTPEPTSGAIWNANRGAVSLRVTVKGKPAHVGLQYRGINAFERMLIVANRLLELKREVEARKTSYKIEPEAARRSILMLGGRCEGGTSFNTLPSACTFTVDRRINPEEDLRSEKQRLLGLFEELRAEGIDLEVEILQEGRAAGNSENHPVAQALAHSVEVVTGKPPVFEMCPGLLEIRFYAERGVPGYAYGPGLLSAAHGPREFVRLDNVYASAAIYALTAAHLLASREVGAANPEHVSSSSRSARISSPGR